MQQLMISKIEVFANGIKHMECIMSGSRTLPLDFENHPLVIYLFGDYYDKINCDSDRNIVHYRTH